MALVTLSFPSYFCGELKKTTTMSMSEFYKNASNDVLQDYMRQQGITL